MSNFVIVAYDEDGTMFGLLPDPDDWTKARVFNSRDAARDFILANSKEGCDLRVWSEEDMS